MNIRAKVSISKGFCSYIEGADVLWGAVTKPLLVTRWPQTRISLDWEIVSSILTMAISSLHSISSSSLVLSSSFPPCLNLSIKPQELPRINCNQRRVWRRRKLTKKDDKLVYKMDRIPFLEERVRKIREAGKLLSMDIERLLLSEENRFDFVNEVAAEAKEYVENNRDKYGSKKAILHVLSNRVNDAGFQRPEAYLDPDPYKPGPSYLREEHI